jgi:hypothetical protein
MLRWFHQRSRSFAATVLLSILAMSASVVTPHADDCHDATCGNAFVLHDASAHRIRAASATDDGHPQHCAVCHFSRSFRPRPQATSLPVPLLEAGVCVHIEVFTAARTAPVAQPPLRSPPASPGLASLA